MYLSKDALIKNIIINAGRRKCFIFDLDGTIIFKDQPLSEENDKLLRLIQDAGHEVVFASGRPYRDFKILMPQWTHDCLLVLFGGALSIQQGQILQSSSISKVASEKLVNFCLEQNHPFIIDDSENYYHPGHGHTFYPYIDSIMGKFRETNLEKMLDGGIFKIFILDDKLLDIFIHKINEHDLNFKLHSKYDSFDILPGGVNKYNGLQPFIKYDVNDIFIFGDDLNDYELFTNFKNTILLGEHPELIPLASLVIPENEAQQANFSTLINTIISN